MSGTTRPAPAPDSARRSAIWSSHVACQRSFGSSLSAGRGLATGSAGPPIRLRPGSGPGGWPVLPCSLMSWAHRDWPGSGPSPRRPAPERGRPTGRGLSLQPRSSGRASSLPSGEFKGVAQVDGYAGFQRLARVWRYPAGGVLVPCPGASFMRCSRRPARRIATETLRRGAKLYAMRGRYPGSDGGRSRDSKSEPLNRSDDGPARDPAYPHPTAQRPGRCHPLCPDPLEQPLLLP
jgi:hypothetical protein